MAIHAHGRTKESTHSTLMRDRYDHINVDELYPAPSLTYSLNQSIPKQTSVDLVQPLEFQ